MKSDFHFHTIRLLAIKAGMDTDTANMMAWASAFVDEANSWEDHGFKTYENAINSLDDTAQRMTWVPFHFWPSDGWIVNPNPHNLRELWWNEKTTRIQDGLFFHVYADTWAHQGFAGVWHYANREGTYPIPPPIGHAQYGNLPDESFRIWRDQSGEAVDNSERFIECAEEIWGLLSNFPMDRTLRGNILTIFNMTNEPDRITNLDSLAGCHISFEDIHDQLWPKLRNEWIEACKAHLSRAIPIMPLEKP